MDAAGKVDWCLHCGEPCDRQDAAGVRRFNNPNVALWIHIECLVHWVIGSICQQIGTARSDGGDWDDPPWLSRREAARLAHGHYLAMGGHILVVEVLAQHSNLIALDNQT